MWNNFVFFKFISFVLRNSSWIISVFRSISFIGQRRHERKAHFTNGIRNALCAPGRAFEASSEWFSKRCAAWPRGGLRPFWQNEFPSRKSLRGCRCRTLLRMPLGLPSFKSGNQTARRFVCPHALQSEITHGGPTLYHGHKSRHNGKFFYLSVKNYFFLYYRDKTWFTQKILISVVKLKRKKKNAYNDCCFFFTFYRLTRYVPPCKIARCWCRGARWICCWLDFPCTIASYVETTWWKY